MSFNKYKSLATTGLLALIASCATLGYKDRIIAKRDSEWRENTIATLDTRRYREKLVLNQGIALRGVTPELVYDVARNLAEYHNNPEAYKSGRVFDVSENDIASAIHEIAVFDEDGNLITKEELDYYGYTLSKLRAQAFTD